MRAFLEVGGLDQRFECVERDDFDAVADRELVALGKFIDRRNEPRQELVVRVNRPPVRFDLSAIGAKASKNYDQGFAPGPKELKRQTFKVRASPNPEACVS